MRWNNSPVENNDVSVTESVGDNSLRRSTSDVLFSMFETRCLTTSSSGAETAAAAAVGSSISSVESLLASMNAQLETRLRSDAQLRRQADKNQQMMNEWMIAAAVVDRICFIIFSLIFVIGTAVMFVLATAVEH